MPELEQFYTTREIGEAMKINASSVQRIFRNIPGVIRISSVERSLLKQRQRAPKIMLRIPAAVYRSWLQAGGSELK